MTKQKVSTPPIPDTSAGWSSNELAMVDTPLRSLRAQVIEIPNVLTAAECERLIDLAEGGGLAQQKYIDSSTAQARARGVLQDESWGPMIWSRISTMPISSITTRAQGGDGIHPDVFEPTPVGVNSFVRVYRYDIGTRFSPHEDAPFTAPDGSRSFLTALVYLNEEFKGGDTIFYVDWRNPDAGHLRIGPKRGTVVLFPHELWHEGAEVTAGQKYVLRTEVMYAPKR